MENQIISPEQTKEKVQILAEQSTGNICVLLGAGASYGYSNQDSPYKPPIVRELFDKSNLIVKQVIGRHHFIESQRDHITRKIASYKGDLEAYLSYLYNKDSEDNTFPSILFYLQDIFQVASKEIDLDNNNYQYLINTLREWRGKNPWSFISFNYDTLLERSLISNSRFINTRNFEKEESYFQSYPKVFKMHGSINFRYHSITAGNNNRSAYEVFTEMMENNKPHEEYLNVISPNNTMPDFYRAYKQNEEVFTLHNLPLMMIPVHRTIKAENSFFAKQIEHAKNEISKSSLVISIGYNFGDEFFVKSLNGLDLKNSQLILVGSDSLVEEKDKHPSYIQALKIWPKENITIFSEGGFGNFVEALYG